MRQAFTDGVRPRPRQAMSTTATALHSASEWHGDSLHHRAPATARGSQPPRRPGGDRPAHEHVLLWGSGERREPRGTLVLMATFRCVSPCAGRWPHTAGVTKVVKSSMWPAATAAACVAPGNPSVCFWTCPVHLTVLARPHTVTGEIKVTRKSRCLPRPTCCCEAADTCSTGRWGHTPHTRACV